STVEGFLAEPPDPPDGCRAPQVHMKAWTALARVFVPQSHDTEASVIDEHQDHIGPRRFGHDPSAQPPTQQPSQGHDNDATEPHPLSRASPPDPPHGRTLIASPSCLSQRSLRPLRSALALRPLGLADLPLLQLDRGLAAEDGDEDSDQALVG